MAAPTYVSTGTAASSTSSAVSPGLPSGWQQGDIFLAFVRYADNNTLTVPSGWAHVNNSPAVHNQAASFGTLSFAVLWKRATSSESSPSINDTGPATSGLIHACISAFRGCKSTGNPWNATAKDTNDALDAQPSISGTSTTVADCLVVVAHAAITNNSASTHYSGWTNGNLSSFTERVDIPSNGNFDGIGMATGVKSTAGSIGTTTVTVTDAAWGVAMVVALEPDAGASPSASSVTGATVTNKATFAAGVLAPGIGV